MNRFFLMVCVFWLAGCANMADSMSALGGVGVISEKVSDFDGSRNVKLSPAFLYNPNAGLLGMNTRLGAFWNSEAPGFVALILENDSVSGYGISYINYESIDINIDGKKLSFDTDGGTKFDNSGYNTVSRTIYTNSKNSATVPVETLKAMINAKDCRLRINTGNGYETAYFSEEKTPGGNSTAKHFLRKFMDKVEGNSAESI